MFNEIFNKTRNELLIKDLRKSREFVSDDLIVRLWDTIVNNEIKEFKKLFMENENLSLYIIDDGGVASKKYIEYKDYSLCDTCSSSLSTVGINYNREFYFLDLFLGLVQYNRYEMIKYVLDHGDKFFTSPRCNYKSIFYYKIPRYLRSGALYSRGTKSNAKKGNIPNNKTIKFLIQKFSKYLTALDLDSGPFFNNAIECKTVFHSITRFADDNLLKYAINHLNKDDIWEISLVCLDMEQKNYNEILHNAIIDNQFLNIKSIEPLFYLLRYELSYFDIIQNEIITILYDLVDLTNDNPTKDLSQFSYRQFTVQDYINRFVEFLRLLDIENGKLSDRLKNKNNRLMRNLLAYTKRINNQNIIKILEERELRLCKQ